MSRRANRAEVVEAFVRIIEEKAGDIDKTRTKVQHWWATAAEVVVVEDRSERRDKERARRVKTLERLC